jgi:uncharacterized protein (DUF1499 family)
MKHIQRDSLTTIGLVILLSSMGWAPAGGEDMINRLKRCPASPNCVCSDDTDSSHGIPPLRVAGEFMPAWTALLNYLEHEPEFTIIEDTGSYLRAEARTRILRFVDDVEFMARPGDDIIAMRSASRLGYSDLGTNRRRLEALRSVLIDAGVVRTIERDAAQRRRRFIA